MLIDRPRFETGLCFLRRFVYELSGWQEWCIHTHNLTESKRSHLMGDTKGKKEKAKDKKQKEAKKEKQKKGK